MDLIWVGIGGAFGSLSRYQLGKIIARRSKSTFPWGTIVINISGAILLGVVSGMGAGSHLSLLVADGFLGAFTTFSTFMYEGFNLIKGNKKKSALAYMLITLLGGILGYVVGYIGQMLF